MDRFIKIIKKDILLPFMVKLSEWTSSAITGLDSGTGAGVFTTAAVPLAEDTRHSAGAQRLSLTNAVGGPILS